MLATLLPVLALLAQDSAPASRAATQPLPDFDRLWNYGKPDETEKKFRALLPRARRSGDRRYLGELLTQIGRTQGLQGRFVEGHAVLDEVAEMLRDAPLPTVRARYLLERGRTWNSSGNHAKGEEKTKRKQRAVACFLAAYHLSRSHGFDYRAIDAAHMLAISLPAAEAMRWHERGRQLAEKSRDPASRTWLGPILNNLAWTYHEQKHYEKALEAFRAAQTFREKQGRTGPILIARWSVARCLRSLGRLQEARKIQEALLAEREQLGKPSGYVFEELGELHLAMGDEKAAKPWFAKAHALLSKDTWLQKNEPERLRRLEELSR